MDAYIPKSTTTFKIILSIKISHSFLRRFITQRPSQFNDSRFSSSARSIFKIQFLQSFYGLYSPKTELNFPQKGLNNSQMGLHSPHKGLNYPQTGLNNPQTGLNNCIHESVVNILSLVHIEPCFENCGILRNKL